MATNTRRKSRFDQGEVRRRSRYDLPENPGGDEERARDRRLAEINAYLTAIDLPPLDRLGDHRKGEIETLGVLGHLGNRWSVLVLFQILDKRGHLGSHVVIYNLGSIVYEEIMPDGTAHPVNVDGAICIVTIFDEHGQEHFVLVRQHRYITDEYELEIPRGFNPGRTLPLGIPLTSLKGQAFDIDPKDLAISRIPIGIIGGELSGLLRSGVAHIRRFAVLALSNENTGIFRVRNVISYLELGTHDMAAVREVKGNEHIELVYLERDHVIRHWPELGLTDALTSSAISFYRTLVLERRARQAQAA